MGFWANLKTLFAGNGPTVASHSEAYDLLESLRRRRTPVCVRLAGHKYSTYILAVDRSKGKRALQLDELMPREGNALAQRNGKLRFEVRGDGDAARFEVKITAVEDGLYYCPLPSTVQVSSQRNSRRVPLKNISHVSVEIISVGRKVINGHLTDASEQGLQLKIKLSEKVLPPFVQGEVIEGHLQLTGGKRVQLSVELRRIQIKQSQQVLLVGARIVGFKDKASERHYLSWLLQAHGKMKNA